MEDLYVLVLVVTVKITLEHAPDTILSLKRLHLMNKLSIILEIFGNLSP